MESAADVRSAVTRGSELRKLLVPEVVFGTGARNLVGRRAALLGSHRVLLVTDPGVIAAGWASEVAASLDAAGLPFVLFSGVTPNPRAAEVMAGAEQYEASGCDVIVAVGGGSAIDCAKGIGIVSSNGGHILEFAGADRIGIPMPPLIAVPTTGGTSADVSQFAVILDPETRTKAAIVSKTVVPDLALVDPMTLTTMDRSLTGLTGLDALVHAIEAFASNASSHLTDIYALDAIRLLSTALLPSMDHPADLALRTQMMQGSLQAGVAFSNASLGAIHAMSHGVGGLLDLPHGECIAMLLRHVLDFNYSAAPERYKSIAEAMGVDVRGLTTPEVRQRLLVKVDELLITVGVNTTLREKGLARTDVPELTSHAVRDICMVTNPRTPNRRDVEVIYEESL